MPALGKPRKKEAAERAPKRGRQQREEAAAGKGPGTAEIGAGRPLKRDVGPLGYRVGWNPGADVLAAAKFRVDLALAARDRLNALYGRKKGGVAR